MARRIAADVNLAEVIYDLCRSKIGSMGPRVYVEVKEICDFLKRKQIEFDIDEVGLALTQLIQKGELEVHLFPNPEVVSFALSR